MVVEFWATWCGPCRAAFPHLSQLARKFRGSGLVVVGVNMEEDSPQIRAFVAQQARRHRRYPASLSQGPDRGASAACSPPAPRPAPPLRPLAALLAAAAAAAVMLPPSILTQLPW